MPAVQHGTDLSETTLETTEIHPLLSHFLHHCQQQSIQAKQTKIASLTFLLSPISPWAVLAALGKDHQRHFYYDPPHRRAMVGLEVLVGQSAQGPERFAQAQEFVHFWRGHFIYAEPIQLVGAGLSNRSAADLSATGHFFCSATFFDQAVGPLLTEVSGPSGESSGELSCGPSFEPTFEPIYVFVPQIQVTTGKTVSAITFNCLISAEADVEQTAVWMYQRLSQLMAAQPVSGMKQPSRKAISKDVAGFKPAVTAALQQVNGGLLHKVVLADVMDVVAPQAVDLVRSLRTLRQNHPDCTVFSVGNGRGQSFIGASPERLLSIVDRQLITDALAGSAPRSQTPGIDIQLAQTLLHSEKERYEHQVVVEFIAEQLRSLGLSPNYASAPQILQLLHIQHLHTPISAILNQSTVAPLEILAKLHPTPAVAGVPREIACQLIAQHESFERGLYAAPLGWIDTQGNSEFIVGIRSALIHGCKARLYAGAGIVAGSEPAKELAEIRLKLQTLLNALV
ncbi:MAG: isochorismate synthase [Phormidesmis sp.]